MKRLAGLLPAVFLFSCGEVPERVPPFISITLVDPEGFSSPQADLFKVVNRAIVDGSPISKEFEIIAPEQPLPTSFSISFSEGLRGNAVEVEVRGFAGGQEVFLATESVIADVSIVEMTARFCGDNNTDNDRGEQCDDGLANSGTAPDACRTTCSLPTCGDGVVDTGSGEECDDGNAIDADGCEADCTLPACGNGIFEPEDFRGFTDGGPAAGCFQPNGQKFLSPGSSEILIEDLDQDGHLDIISGSFEDPVLVVIFGNGDGTFQQPIFLSTLSGTHSIAAGVFTEGDPFLDIAGVSFAQDFQGDVALTETKNNDRALTVSPLVNPCAAGFDCSVGFDIVSGNLDQDNIDDLIIVANQAFYVDKEIQDNPNEIIALPYVPEGTLISSTILDMNLDGNQDIILFDTISNQTKIITIRNEGNDIFNPNLPLPILFNFNINTLTGRRIAQVDFNKDGLNDIAAFDLNQNRIVFLVRNGSSFQNTLQSLPSAACSYITSSDLDKDTFKDVICLNSIEFNPEGSSISFALSGENFTQEHRYIFSDKIFTSVGSGDFDEDGFQDLAIGRNENSGLSVIETLLFKP